MKYGAWEARWEIRPEGIIWKVCREEIGGEFTGREEAERIAYELNKEANGELDE